MKRIIFFTLLLAASIFTVSCSVDSSTTDTMAPLPTTGLDRTADKTVVITDPPPTTVWTDGLTAYLDYMYLNADVPVSIIDSDLLSYANTWCDFMRRGMAKTNVIDWINEMAADQTEIDLWTISAQASATYICSDQEYKWNP